MKKKQPPAKPTDDLRAGAERLLVEAAPDRGKISGYNENRLVHERQGQ